MKTKDVKSAVESRVLSLRVSDGTMRALRFAAADQNTTVSQILKREIDRVAATAKGRYIVAHS